MKTQKTKTEKPEVVEVLYQKLGSKWFAFSLIEDELFVGSVSQDELDVVEKKAKLARIAGKA